MISPPIIKPRFSRNLFVSSLPLIFLICISVPIPAIVKGISSTCFLFHMQLVYTYFYYKSITFFKFYVNQIKFSNQMLRENETHYSKKKRDTRFSHMSLFLRYGSSNRILFFFHTQSEQNTFNTHEIFHIKRFSALSAIAVRPVQLICLP